MTPSINVNLTPCNHWKMMPHATRDGSLASHNPECTPRLILCPLEPFRSVTFSVVLGECRNPCLSVAHYPDWQHASNCAARPLRVSCSISGKTWEESEVEDVEPHYSEPAQRNDAWKAMLLSVGADTPHLRAARHRWALVKALVLGHAQPDVMELVGRWNIADAYTQRDAVYAALTDMARHEEAALVAQKNADDAFPFDRYRKSDADHRRFAPSRERLAAFVAYVVEQVGATP